MTQADLNRAIARATGESVAHIARLGFSLVVVPDRPSRNGRQRSGIAARGCRVRPKSIPRPRQSA